MKHLNFILGILFTISTSANSVYGIESEELDCNYTTASVGSLKYSYLAKIGSKADLIQVYSSPPSGFMNLPGPIFEIDVIPGQLFSIEETRLVSSTLGSEVWGRLKNLDESPAIYNYWIKLGSNFDGHLVNPILGICTYSK